MSSSLPPEIRSLPVSDRLQLVEQIWESIAEDEGEFVLTTAQRAELDRRLERHSKNPQAGRSWGEIRDELLGAE